MDGRTMKYFVAAITQCQHTCRLAILWVWVRRQQSLQPTAFTTGTAVCRNRLPLYNLRNDCLS
jgi:hypothetical protein